MSRAIILSFIFFWCVLIVVTPVLFSFDGTAHTIAIVLYKFYSTVCHQFDSHSFHLCGNKFAVCIRCSSIYFGFFLGGIFLPMIKKMVRQKFSSLQIIFFASLPMLVDVLCSWCGIHESTTTTKMISGGMFGVLIAYVLIPELVDIDVMRRINRT